MFLLNSTGDLGRTVMFLQVPDDGLSGMFDVGKGGVTLWTPPGMEEPLEVLEVQGRPLRVVHLNHTGEEDSGEEQAPGIALTLDGPAVSLDLTPDGSDSPVVLTFTYSEDNELSPEDIHRFLAPFHVGPTRPDPESQWENLRGLVEFDERPAGWEMEIAVRSNLLDTRMFVLTSVDGLDRTIMFLQMGDESLSEMFDTNKEGVSLWTPPGTVEPVEFLEVQGRKLRVVHLAPEEIDGFDPEGMPAVQMTHAGPVVALVLTPEGTSAPVALTLEDAEVGALTPDEIRRFLAPFHIGPNR
jgi:hypothetical protein